jgi:uncharacterized DUF497 family protein
VVYEWNAAKAKANIQKHGVSFDDSATVFLDPLALTYPDPCHSGGKEREITIGYTAGHQAVFVAHCERGNRYESSAHEGRPAKSASNMKKASTKRVDDDLLPEYDLSKLKGGVRGKYYRQAVAGTNLMLIEPDLAEVFCDAASVNRALRLLVDTAAAAAGPVRRRHRVLTKRK